MRGLLVFSQDSVVCFDEQGNKTTKVSIYHISTVNSSELELILELAMDFIWKTMHCAVIRVHLHHITLPNRKMTANSEFKRILKSRGFRWKVLTNSAGATRRVEILELKNKKYTEQLKASTAFLYRRNLNISDF